MLSMVTHACNPRLGKSGDKDHSEFWGQDQLHSEFKSSLAHTAKSGLKNKEDRKIGKGVIRY